MLTTTLSKTSLNFDWPAKPETDHIVPGQVWRWELKFKDGTWFLTKCDPHHSQHSQQVTTIHYGDIFTIVSAYVVDTLPSLWSYEQIGNDDVQGYHIILLNNQLVWLQHKDLSVAKLVIP